MNKYIFIFKSLLIFSSLYSFASETKRRKTQPIQTQQIKQGWPWLQFADAEKPVQIDPSIVNKFDTLKNMLEDLGATTEEDYLPINFSSERWKQVTNALQLAAQNNPDVYVSAFQTLGSQKSQDLLNDFNYLAGPQEVLDMMTQAYGKYLFTLNTIEINNLVPDLQKLIIKPFFDKAITFIMHKASELNNTGRKKQLEIHAKPDERFVDAVAYVKKHKVILTIAYKNNKHFLQARTSKGVLIREQELPITQGILSLHYNEKRSLIIVTNRNPSLANPTTTLLYTLDDAMNFVHRHTFNFPFTTLCFVPLQDNNNLIYLYKYNNLNKVMGVSITDLENPHYFETELSVSPMKCQISANGKYLIYSVTENYIYYLEINPRETITQLNKIAKPASFIRLIQFINDKQFLLIVRNNLFICDLSLTAPSLNQIADPGAIDMQGQIRDHKVDFGLELLLTKSDKTMGRGFFGYISSLVSLITKKLIGEIPGNYSFLPGSQLLYNNFRDVYLTFVNVYPDVVEEFAQNYLYPLENSENSLLKMLFILKVVNMAKEGNPLVLNTTAEDFEIYSSLPVQLQLFLYKEKYIIPQEDDWELGLYLNKISTAIEAR